MGIRNTLDQHKYGTAAVCSAVVVLCILSIALHSKGRAAPNTSQAFYSVDDGRTWFVDDVDRLSPFDHNGQQAVRAYVWKCRGTEFVSYLEKRTSEANEKVQAVRQRGPVTTEALAAIDVTGLQVKKPGENTWCGERNLKFVAIVRPGCPDGSTDDLEPVYP